MKVIFRSLLASALISEIVVFSLVNTSPGVSGWWFLLPITLIAAALFILFRVMWRDCHHSGGSWASSLSITAPKFGMPRKVLALIVSEVSSLTSALNIFSSSGNPKRNREFYTVHKNLRTVIFVVLGLSAVEISVVHLAVPSKFWRYLFLAISIYAVVLLTGFYASVRDRPHFMTPQGLVIRYGKRLICEIPWLHLTSAKSVGAGQGGDITVDGNGHLRIPVLSEVNVRLEVDPSVPVEDLYKGRVKASSIEIYCDDKESFLQDVAKRRSQFA